MQLTTDLFGEIQTELKELKKAHPWPVHVVAQVAAVVSAASELFNTAVQVKYKSRKNPASKPELFATMRQQAIKTAATTIRFIENLSHGEKHLHSTNVQELSEVLSDSSDGDIQTAEQAEQRIGEHEGCEEIIQERSEEVYYPEAEMSGERL